MEKGGTPRRLTPANFGPLEFQAAFSPDGRSIAFTTWHDTERGALWVTDARGGAPRRLTRDPGEYANPIWAPNGRDVMVARGAGATARAQTLSRNPFFDLVTIPAGGGDETLIVQVIRTGDSPNTIVRPTIGTDGRVYFAEPKSFGPGDGLRPNAGAE